MKKRLYSYLEQLRPTKVKKWIGAHKVISTVVVIAVCGGLYGRFHSTSASTETRYVLGTVKNGTVESTISGTGTVSASNQLDVKAKASGDVLSVSVKAGDNVGVGQPLATLDAEDARVALENAQISYDKLTEPADDATVSSNQSALLDAETAETKAYNSSENDLSNVFIELGSVLDGLDSLMNYSDGFISDLAVRYAGDSGIEDRNTADTDFYKTQTEFNTLTNEFKTLSSTSSPSLVEKVTTDGYTVAKDLAQTLRETKIAVDYTKANVSANQAAAGTAAQNDIATWTSTNTSLESALLSDVSSITTSHLSVVNKQAAIDKATQGPDPLDLESAKLDLLQKQEAYNDATIRAPFSGVVGKVDVKRGDSVSSGTVVATLITPDEEADVSLNEVDASKVKIGDKAVLTFDAVDGLTLNGVVSEIDLIGTVTQGVVTYNTKIAFDTQDPRVHPGMSANAEIVTDSKSDVLVVPSSAVKTFRGSSFVEVLDSSAALSPQGVTSATPPKEVKVETGLVGDTTTEIVSGLTAGDEVVVRTISPTTTTATGATTQPTFFGGGGGAARGGVTTGGATRALGR